MGCGASAQAEPDAPAEAKPQQEGGYNATAGTYAKIQQGYKPPGPSGMMSEAERAELCGSDPEPGEYPGAPYKDSDPSMPFVRFDKSTVPRECFPGDALFLMKGETDTGLKFGDNNQLWCGEDSEIFLLEAIHTDAMDRHKSEYESRFIDGDYVTIQSRASGTYLTCFSDHEPLLLEPKRERGQGNEMQYFRICKVGKEANAS